MVTKVKLTGGGVMKLTEDLRKQFSSAPKTTMQTRRSPSKIMIQVVKKAGLC